MTFKEEGLKLVTGGKVSGAAAVRLAGHSKGQSNVQVWSFSFCPVTSTILSDILEAWGVRYLPRTANTRNKSTLLLGF